MYYKLKFTKLKQNRRIDLKTYIFQNSFLGSKRSVATTFNGIFNYLAAIWIDKSEIFRLSHPFKDKKVFGGLEWRTPYVDSIAVIAGFLLTLSHHVGFTIFSANVYLKDEFYDRRFIRLSVHCS